jgi:hypothetical protein
MQVREVVLIGLGMAMPCTAMSQAVFKCLEGRSITYSSTPCAELGLKPGGEIRDRVTTVPAVKRPSAAGPSTLSQKAPAGRTENDVDMPKTSTLKPINPLIDKLAK